MFVKQNYLEEHLTVVHEKLKIYECQICKKTFGFNLEIWSNTSTTVHEGITPSVTR